MNLTKNYYTFTFISSYELKIIKWKGLWYIVKIYYNLNDRHLSDLPI